MALVEWSLLVGLLMVVEGPVLMGVEHWTELMVELPAEETMRVLMAAEFQMQVEVKQQMVDETAEEEMKWESRSQTDSEEAIVAAATVTEY